MWWTPSAPHRHYSEYQWADRPWSLRRGSGRHLLDHEWREALPSRASVSVASEKVGAFKHKSEFWKCICCSELTVSQYSETGLTRYLAILVNASLKYHIIKCAGEGRFPASSASTTSQRPPSPSVRDGHDLPAGPHQECPGAGVLVTLPQGALSQRRE